MKSKTLKKKLTGKKKKGTKKKRVVYISTGSTLLNLACSGNPHKGFRAGKYYLFVGDSSSGKTFITLTCLAEAAASKQFDDYRFIYDNSEDGALMDMPKFFGDKVAKRMEPPAWDKKEEVYSETIEDFYDHIDDAAEVGKPFIYILDSMDGLSSVYEGEKFDQQKDARRKGKKAAGSFGDGKAKKNSAGVRRLIPILRKTNSILIVINQTRANLGFGPSTKTRSGGNALTFYACLEIWSAIKGRLYKTVKGKPRQIGITCLCQTKKNRLNGRERRIELPIYHSFGIDDVGGCVDYLLEEKHWPKKKKSKKHAGGYDAKEFGVRGSREKIIRHIEKNGLEFDLREIVGEVWSDIEDACVVKRKKRYA